MLQLDYLGLLLSVFLLGPAQWRWTLMAAALAKLVTVFLLAAWQVDLVVYTMGGVFSQVELSEGVLAPLAATAVGPFCCYTVARLVTSRPLGQKGLAHQLLPWSELEHPMAATFVKYALLSALFGLYKLI